MSAVPISGQDIEATPARRILSDLWQVDRIAQREDGDETEAMATFMKRLLGAR